jgi:hypothetical protein
MGIPIYFGTKLYGWHDNGDGTSTATQFFHIYYVPIFPTRSFRVIAHDPATGRSDVQPRGMHLPSVLGTYYKVWGFVAAVVLGMWAGDALRRPGHMLGGLAGAIFSLLLMMSVVAAWFWIGRQPGAPSTVGRKVAMALCFGVPILVGGWHFASMAHEGMRRALRDPFSMFDTKDAANFVVQMQLRELADQQARCDSGDSYACYTLAGHYEHGSDGAKLDLDKAIALYQKACAAKQLSTCFHLGMLLDDRKDGPGALDAFRRACDLGSAAGCNNVGVAYFTGAGIPKDVDQGIAFYQKACDGKEGLACNNLGNIYKEGKAVKKDKARAKALFKAGCDAGNRSACTNYRSRR